MSNVSLQIGGRSYSVACAAGEEDHIARLGGLIDQKVQSMGSGHTEVRQLLFAALILADELHEARSGHTPAPAPAPAPAAPDHSASLEAIAERLENAPQPLRVRAPSPI